MSERPMVNPFGHRYGHLRATFGPAWHHLRRCVSDPEYRTLHRLARHLSRTPRFSPGVVTYRGQPIRYVDAASFLSAWEEIFVNRCYDVAGLSSRPRLVDVGANIGLAALYWRTRLTRFCYLGLEPDPLAVEACGENLRAWSVDGEVRACAVTASGDAAEFRRNFADGGRVVRNEGGRDTIRVPAIRLSSLLDDPVDLLKIDIEGAELPVLSEAAGHLSRVRNVFVEYHLDMGERPALGKVIGILESAGFVCFVHPGLVPSRPFLSEWRNSGPFAQLVNIFAMRQSASSQS